MPILRSGCLFATISLGVVASLQQGFLVANKDCKLGALCDAFCEESSLSKAAGLSANSKKLAALEINLRDCGQYCACPFGMERHPPTPYPAPPPPAVPFGMFHAYGNGFPGDPRIGGDPSLPAVSCKHCPPILPPLPPLPPVPMADFSTVGQRFLPRLAMPKGEVNEHQDLDYEGNPVPTTPNYNLPAGWQASMYEGKPYYLNEATGESSWVHPEHPHATGVETAPTGDRAWKASHP